MGVLVTEECMQCEWSLHYVHASQGKCKALCCCLVRVDLEDSKFQEPQDFMLQLTKFKISTCIPYQKDKYNKSKI